MAIETWDSPYIVIWLCLGVLVTVLTYGVRGYNGKISGIGAVVYGLLIMILSALDGAALGQYMYDKTEKYNFLGSIGMTLGLSGPLLISGLILFLFYRNRVVKHSDEIVLRDGNLEISESYLLGEITWLMFLGLLALGIGAGHIVMALVGDREGLLIASTVLIPLIVAIWLITQYRKWMFKYIVWVLRRKGLLQVVGDKDSK
ncbi:hypothetical protein [Ligilactobacillus murinus]|uniref:Uncharacterized protein n=1 Tax=Ligilactobacillus murinus TaxID=1622 RepID=A0AAE7BQ80_9LACO|nr:hypothetical protein [Ligilactobacillus murinus]NEF83767.1 hypothetical protein [Ligilactobacillus murinus]NEF85823.1 hypothetical protein [Ligilactobacillus murinus]NEF88188.1 hypothetical protein [Ligilactobacillus murinus]NEF90609.1 hypothetical protein [Ligilactobacillus murinus]NEF92723.1 hypothetical protein [Ligilactobacillus murinus]